MTRNRATELAPPAGAAVRRAVAIALTLALLAPAAALLLARVRALTALESAGAGAGCSGLDTLGPLLHAGLPTVALLVILPVALLSLADRARGWIWLGLALVGTVLLDVALRSVFPACL